MVNTPVPTLHNSSASSLENPAEAQQLAAAPHTPATRFSNLSIFTDRVTPIKSRLSPLADVVAKLSGSLSTNLQKLLPAVPKEHFEKLGRLHQERGESARHLGQLRENQGSFSLLNLDPGLPGLEELRSQIDRYANYDSLVNSATAHVNSTKGIAKRTSENVELSHRVYNSKGEVREKFTHELPGALDTLKVGLTELSDSLDAQQNVRDDMNQATTHLEESDYLHNQITKIISKLELYGPDANFSEKIDENMNLSASLHLKLGFDYLNNQKTDLAGQHFTAASRMNAHRDNQRAQSHLQLYLLQHHLVDLNAACLHWQLNAPLAELYMALAGEESSLDAKKMLYLKADFFASLEPQQERNGLLRAEVEAHLRNLHPLESSPSLVLKLIQHHLDQSPGMPPSRIVQNAVASTRGVLTVINHNAQAINIENGDEFKLLISCLIAHKQSGTDKQALQTQINSRLRLSGLDVRRNILIELSQDLLRNQFTPNSMQQYHDRIADLAGAVISPAYGHAYRLVMAELENNPAQQQAIWKAVSTSSNPEMASFACMRIVQTSRHIPDIQKALIEIRRRPENPEVSSLANLRAMQIAPSQRVNTFWKQLQTGAAQPETMAQAYALRLKRQLHDPAAMDSRLYIQLKTEATLQMCRLSALNANPEEAGQSIQIAERLAEPLQWLALHTDRTLRTALARLNENAYTQYTQGEFHNPALKMLVLEHHRFFEQAIKQNTTLLHAAIAEGDETKQEKTANHLNELLAHWLTKNPVLGQHIDRQRPALSQLATQLDALTKRLETAALELVYERGPVQKLADAQFNYYARQLAQFEQGIPFGEAHAGDQPTPSPAQWLLALNSTHKDLRALRSTFEKVGEYVLNKRQRQRYTQLIVPRRLLGTVRRLGTVNGENVYAKEKSIYNALADQTSTLIHRAQQQAIQHWAKHPGSLQARNMQAENNDLITTLQQHNTPLQAWAQLGGQILEMRNSADFMACCKAIQQHLETQAGNVSNPPLPKADIKQLLKGLGLDPYYDSKIHNTPGQIAALIESNAKASMQNWVDPEDQLMKDILQRN